jgi:hypothetical protein
VKTKCKGLSGGSKCFVACLLIPVIVVAGLLLVGCEDGGEANLINVSPEEVYMSTPTQIFTVSDTTNTVSGLRNLSLPIEWSVSNPGLGNIIAVNADSAVYSRTTSAGVNIIMAKDQYGAEGIATVIQ